MDPNIVRWFAKSSPDVLGGVTPEQMFAKMDAAGVQVGLLTSGIGGVPKNPYQGGYEDFTLEKFAAICEKVAAVCRQFPGRYYGARDDRPRRG
jgi:predicted TIM-barrel fold metal-dependent hydrolase